MSALASHASSASFAELLAEDEDAGAGACDRYVIRDNLVADECVLYLGAPADALGATSTKPRDTGATARRGGGRAATHERPRTSTSCPFCPGNEKLCADAVAEVCTADGAWAARCFENRFPIFHALGSGGAKPGANYARATARMEVVVAARRHDVDLAQQSADEVGRLVRLARDRARAVAGAPGCRHVRVFQNHGSRAGGSLVHAHWQVVGLGFVPPRARHLVRAQATAAATKKCACAVCELARDPDPSTVVWRDDRCVAVAAVAARAGTCWVVPRACAPSLADLDDASCRSVGAALRAVAAATYAAYGDPDYNVAFAARPSGDSATFHAYAVFSPHLKEDCSLATLQYGLPICHTAPEDAAFALRRALAALG